MHRKKRMGIGQIWRSKSIVHWLDAKFLDRKANSKLLCNMDSVEMRAPPGLSGLTMKQVRVPCSR